MPCNVCPIVCLFITHAPLFRRGAICVYPKGDSSLVMNNHNPFMHCITSKYVSKPRDVIMLNNRTSLATITYATASPCHVSLNGMFLQVSSAQWNKLRMWKISNFVSPNSLSKCHLNSVWTKYLCDKSENVRVRTKWQWNALDWCYWIAFPASPVMQSSNTVWCISLSFRTHPCVLDILSHPIYPSIAYNI